MSSAFLSSSDINSFSGSLNPNSKDVKRKIRMLRKEGVDVKDNKIVEFEKVVFRFF